MTPDERIEELEREVARLREQIGVLYKHLGIGQLGAASSGPNPAILDAIRSGQTIVAIKLYREQTGVGLKEAKDAVEDLARTLR
ncbi:ribosomal protein L7/L12 [Schumannella luteola]